MPRGQALESLQILRDVPRELPVLADGAAAIQGRDDGQFHTATSNLIGSYDSYPTNVKFSNVKFVDGHVVDFQARGAASGCA